MSEKELQIIVDDGFRKIPIKNGYGDEIGVFYFNPTDVAIVDRYNEIAKTFGTITEPLAEPVPEGLSDEDQMNFIIEQKKKATDRLYEACNKLFGGDFASAFFGKTDPFSPVDDGVFYCEKALESVGKFISAQYDEKVEKMSERVQKYTNRAARRAAKKK